MALQSTPFKALAPYFPWTADMVRVLGERQPVVVKFHYW
jgi:hypothetical protein